MRHLISLFISINLIANNSRRADSQSSRKFWYLPDSVLFSSESSQTVDLSSDKQAWNSSASSGSVNRINYNVNEDISGIIAPEGAGLITLMFDSFDTEEEYDFVTVKSCTSIDCSETMVLGEYSGSTIPSPVTSYTGIMLIGWSSDDSVTFSGWSAHWSSGIQVLVFKSAPVLANSI
jgi:hypothetical protein